MCITDHFLFRDDVIRIKDLYLTSPERTLIDVIRLSSCVTDEKISMFKYLEEPYELSEEKLISCLYRMRNFKNIDYVMGILYRHSFIKDLLDF